MMFGDVNRAAKILVSLGATASATFLGTFGAAGLSHIGAGSSIGMSLALALCEACLSTAGIILFWWKRSALTKDLAISIPSNLEAAQNEILAKQGITTMQGGK